MILGLTGYLACGKGTVIDFLKDKREFISFSCSDILREECKLRGLELTRDNLQNLGNELREKYGNGILAEKIVEKINSDKTRNYVIDSIRTPDEIEVFRKLKEFRLVFVDSPIETRYERAKLRLKEKEHVDSLEDFRQSEEKERINPNPNSQKLDDCKNLKDYTLLNDSSLEDLYSRILDLLLKIQIDLRKKPDWDSYFLKVAEDISKRSNCLSSTGGAVIVKDNVILSTGYIGSPRGVKDCFEKGYCLRRKLNVPSGQKYEICASVHAEQNAIINAAREGQKIVGAKMYLFFKKIYLGDEKIVKAYPCYICKKMIINAGIDEFIGFDENLNIVHYKVSDWVDELNQKDLIFSKDKYDSNYKK